MSMKNYRYVDHDEEMSEKLSDDYAKIIGEMVGKKILDIGCGAGTISRYLVERNEVHGLDSSQAAVEQARKRGIKAQVFDVTNRLPFEDAIFDIVICKDLLEHLENPQKVLKEIKRVLRTGASLWVSVPNQFNIVDRFRILLGKGMTIPRWFPGSEEWNFPHLRFFTRHGFKKLLAEEGFIIRRDFSHVGAFHIPILRLRLVVLAKLMPSLFTPGMSFECVKG